MMRDKRVMSYLRHIIWMNETAFMVAKGDGTDEYFENLQDAMNYIEKIEEGKKHAKSGKSKAASF